MSVDVGSKAPDFTMPTDGNGSVTLSKLKGIFTQRTTPRVVPPRLADFAIRFRTTPGLAQS